MEKISNYEDLCEEFKRQEEIHHFPSRLPLKAELQVYPDHTLSGWEQNIAEYTAMYILHDKDVKPDGTPIAAHYHIIIWSQRQKSLYAFCRDVGIVPCHVEAVKHPTSMEEYLTHKKNPDKYQYAVETVVTHGNWEGWDAPARQGSGRGSVDFSRLFDYIITMETADGESIPVNVDWNLLFRENPDMIPYASNLQRTCELMGIDTRNRELQNTRKMTDIITGEVCGIVSEYIRKMEKVRKYEEELRREVEKL